MPVNKWLSIYNVIPSNKRDGAEGSSYNQIILQASFSTARGLHMLGTKRVTTRVAVLCRSFTHTHTHTHTHHIFNTHNLVYCRYQCPRCLRRKSRAARLLRSWVRIPPGAWMFVCFVWCVLSGRGLCDELITRPEESYRLWRVIVCDQETSWMRRP
jgi:hypothetical protein